MLNWHFIGRASVPAFRLFAHAGGFSRHVYPTIPHLELVLFNWSDHYLAIEVTGLFWSQHFVQPYWDLAKFRDLLQHIWLQVLVLEVCGTAGIIRVICANLLYETKIPIWRLL